MQILSQNLGSFSEPAIVILIAGSENEPSFWLRIRAQNQARFLLLLETIFKDPGHRFQPRGGADPAQGRCRFRGRRGPIPHSRAPHFRGPQGVFPDPLGGGFALPLEAKSSGPSQSGFHAPVGLLWLLAEQFPTSLAGYISSKRVARKGLPHTFKNDQLVSHTFCFIYVMGQTPLPSCISNTNGCKMVPLWCHRGLTTSATTKQTVFDIVCKGCKLRFQYFCIGLS